jgi:hypothetical protein
MKTNLKPIQTNIKNTTLNQRLEILLKQVKITEIEVKLLLSSLSLIPLHINSDCLLCKNNEFTGVYDVYDSIENKIYLVYNRKLHYMIIAEKINKSTFRPINIHPFYLLKIFKHRFNNLFILTTNTEAIKNLNIQRYLDLLLENENLYQVFLKIHNQFTS